MGKKTSLYVQMEMFVSDSPELKPGAHIPPFFQEAVPIDPPKKPLIDFAKMYKGFSRDEAKVLRAGFSLVKYIREEKKILQSCTDPLLGWFLVSIHQTYAAAERTLKVKLEDGCIETSTAGTVWGSARKLIVAGFDFYRSEGIMVGHGSPRIKQASKNWGTWKKFSSQKEVKAAWAELMKDEKALEG